MNQLDYLNTKMEGLYLMIDAVSMMVIIILLIFAVDILSSRK
jgi:hypothetical protein